MRGRCSCTGGATSTTATQGRGTKRLVYAFPVINGRPSSSNLILIHLTASSVHFDRFDVISSWRIRLFVTLLTLTLNALDGILLTRY